MNIVLDGTPCSASADTVGEAIDAASAAAMALGRRVIEVIVDGETLASADLQSPALLTRKAGEVRMLTADPALLVRETFLQAADSLDEIRAKQELAAELLQTGDVAGAMDTLDQAISTWMLVQDAVVNGARFAGIDLDSIRAGDAAASDVARRLTQRLSDMAGALRRRDHIALSDTLLYEMPDVIATWKAVLTRLARGE